MSFRGSSPGCCFCSFSAPGVKSRALEHLSHDQQTRSETLLKKFEPKQEKLHALASFLSGFPTYHSLLSTLAEQCLDIDAPIFPNHQTWLHQAAKNDNPELISTLLSRCINPNAIDSDGSTPLRIAIEERKVTSATQLLKSGVTVNPERSTEMINTAIRNGMIDIIPALIAAGADINAHDDLGYTPLESAIYSQNIDAALALLQNGAKVNPEKCADMLYTVISSEMIHLIPLLVQASADINTPDTTGQTTPFTRTILNQNTAGALSLPQNGAQVNPQNSASLISMAIINGMTNLIPDLIQAGADINAEDSEGNTALYQAILNHNEDGILALLKNGAQVSPQHTASLINMAILNEMTDVLPALIAASIDINAQDNEGNTALSWAILHRSIDSALVLLKNGAQASLEQGADLIDMTISNGMVDMIPAFLAAGVDINARNSSGYTAPDKACSNNDTDAALKLLAAGADPTMNADSNSFTPLERAEMHGNEQLIQALRKKTDPEAPQQD